jgi:peptide/nickel transport system permease protein
VQDSNENLSPKQMAWNRFKKNRLAVFGLVVIVLAALVAILGGLIRPDHSQNANTQELALSKKGINFKVEGIAIAKNQKDESVYFWNQMFFGGKNEPYNFLPFNSFQIQGDSISGFVYAGDGIKGQPFQYHLMDVVYALEPSSISKQGDSYTAVSVLGENLSETRADLIAEIEANQIYQKHFLLGTDRFGRDLLSRLLAGTIVSLSVGLISVFISLILGIGLGAIAGYFGGWVDDLITWLINVIWSIPTLLLVIAITFALGKGFVQVFVAVGLTMWVEVARVVRGQVLSLKNMEYIEAARALGFGVPRIITRHVIPNIMGPVIVVSAANFASAILLEAGLSFLGIGAQIPMASWGQMIKEHYAYITTDMAYLAILPGLCILVLVLAFMLIGSGLRDSLDTKSV